MSFQDDQVFLEKYLDENLNTVLGLRLAGKYISSDNLEGAHLILSEFLESHPNNPTAKFLMGEIAFKEGNNDKAKSHYEDTIQVDPTFAAAYHRLVTISSDDGDEAGVTEIYRLLNLVIPMDKKAAAELEGKEEAAASKSAFAGRLQNKFLLSSLGDSGSSSEPEELKEETEENVDSLADELTSKLDAEDSTNLDIPLEGVKDETDTEEENKETEVSDISTEDKASGEGEEAFDLEADSEKEEDSAAPDETDSIESTDESRVESVDAESEEDVSSIEDSESTEVDAFGVSVGDDEIETISPEEESVDSVEVEEIPDEEVSSGEDSESTEVDAFGIGEASEETSKEVGEPSEEEPSDADGSDIISEDIAPEEDSGNGDVEAATEDPFTEEAGQVEKNDGDEKSEEISSVESSEENVDSLADELSSKLDAEDSTNLDLPLDDAKDETDTDEENKETEVSDISTADKDSDEGESSDSTDSIEEKTSEKEIDETGSESSAESADKTDSESDSSVVGKYKSPIEMPPFSKETLTDVIKSEESEIVSEENLESEEEAKTDEEEIDEDTNENVGEGVESLNLPLDSTVDATSTEDNVIVEENDSNEESEGGKSDTDEHNIPVDSVEETDKGLPETPSDFESWVEKDVTPESMTTGEGDANEDHKNTFEGLLSEDETSGEVDTMELPEESDTGLPVEEEQDIQEKLDDIYSLSQIDDEEDISPLQAWFLDRKTLHDDQDQNEHQVEDEETPDAITEPKPVPFSGESESEAEALQDTEENESEEKWDKFVDTVVEKKGGDDPNDRESVSTDIDKELRNIFDEVATPANEQDIDEANADAPDITGGVKLNSDLATFTLADIYINQSQFNEALSVLDLLEQKGENLERVTSMREEIKVKIEARNK